MYDKPQYTNDPYVLHELLHRQIFSKYLYGCFLSNIALTRRLMCSLRYITSTRDACSGTRVRLIPFSWPPELRSLYCQTRCQPSQRQYPLCHASLHCHSRCHSPQRWYQHCHPSLCCLSYFHSFRHQYPSCHSSTTPRKCSSVPIIISNGQCYLSSTNVQRGF